MSDQEPPAWLFHEARHVISVTVEGLGRRTGNTFVVTGAVLRGITVAPAKTIVGMELHERAVQTVEGWLNDVFSRPIPDPDYIEIPQAPNTPIKPKRSFRAWLRDAFLYWADKLAR